MGAKSATKKVNPRLQQVTIGSTLIGSKELKMRIKTACIKKDMTINDVLTKAVEQWLKRNGI